MPSPGFIVRNLHSDCYGFVIDGYSGKWIEHPFLEVLTEYGLDEWYVSESDLLFNVNEVV